jgi:Berberine and berberine like
MATHVTDSSQDALEGKVIFPEDDRYDEAGLAWNLALDQRPAAVVFPHAMDRCRAGRGPQNGAQASIDAPYAMYGVGMAPSPEVELIVRGQVDALMGAMSPWTASHKYCNFTETTQRGETLWSESSIQRLRQIKAAVDPEDRIRSNHPVAA